MASGVRSTGITGRAFRQTLLATALALLPELATPSEAQLNPGDIVVADFEAGTNGQGLLFRVDRATGVRTVLSDVQRRVVARLPALLQGLRVSLAPTARL